MKNALLSCIILLFVVLTGCKSKTESNTPGVVTKKEAATTIRGNFVQYFSRGPVTEYVEVVVVDSTFLTYNQSWGFFDTKSFRYRIEGDSLIFYNRKPGPGQKARLYTFLPDSFKLDYGYQTITYYRLMEKDLWQTYDDLKQESFMAGYTHRREAWIKKHRKK